MAITDEDLGRLTKFFDSREEVFKKKRAGDRREFLVRVFILFFLITFSSGFYVGTKINQNLYSNNIQITNGGITTFETCNVNVKITNGVQNLTIYDCKNNG